ncbi:MAG: response regulator [Pseudomonadales bacterium]|nr:response regulator [Pseudomonadales bacterium]
MDFSAHPKRMFRIKNTMMAVAAGIVLTLLCVYAYFTGRLNIAPETGIAIAVISWCVSGIIFSLIATGYTERFSDPGLTSIQIYWTLSNTLMTLVMLDGFRHILVILILAPMMIGALRLRRRQYLLISLYASVVYASTVVFNMLHSPIINPSQSWLSQPVLDEVANVLVFAFICYILAELGSGVSWYRESLKRKNVELEKALEAKSQFLANMSHELRTPLNGIVGMTSLMMDTQLDSDQKECAQAVMVSSNALAEIIDNVLDFSKIEANELKLDYQTFSLQALVEDAVLITLPRAREKRLCYEVNIDPSIAPQLIGDALRIKQVLVNLLSNAIKFTSNGYVLISVQQRQQKKGLASLHFCVEDSGVGIAKDKLESIFEMFSQEDGSTSRLFGGTGLGLSISSSLLALMGSSIQVESEKGQTTTFSFELDLQVASAKPAVRKESVQTTRQSTEQFLAGCLIITREDLPRSRDLRDQQVTAYGAKTLSVVSLTALQAQLTCLAADHKGRVIILLDDSKENIIDKNEIENLRAHSPVELIIVGLPLYGTKAQIQQLKTQGFDYAFPKPFFNHALQASTDTISASLLSAMGIERRNNKKIADYQAYNASILVVEDNRVNQMVICKLLQKMACTVELAENGLQALESCQQKSYDLILMDCQMPEMDGYQAAAELRAGQGLNAQTPIVALTANALDGDKQKCMDAGMSDYMSKPVKIEQLQTMLSCYVG